MVARAWTVIWIYGTHAFVMTVSIFLNFYLYCMLLCHSVWMADFCWIHLFVIFDLPSTFAIFAIVSNQVVARFIRMLNVRICHKHICVFSSYIHQVVVGVGKVIWHLYEKVILCWWQHFDCILLLLLIDWLVDRLIDHRLVGWLIE